MNEAGYTTLMDIELNQPTGQQAGRTDTEMISAVKQYNGKIVPLDIGGLIFRYPDGFGVCKPGTIVIS